jgi:diketogulonate reductase-like aldo/keto reductase
MSIDINTTIKLNNGVEMPIFGLGVWKSDQGGEVESAIENALETGYRSIDTASIYLNENGVGDALQQTSIPREEVFVTSKVWNSDQGYDSTLAAFEKSLEKLKLDYLDLYLVHWPVSTMFNDTWKAMETIYKSGKARAVGVSNFLVHHLEDLLSSTELIPTVNQIEFHPHLVQQELLDYCESKSIQVEAWSPLMQGRIDEVNELVQIASKYEKSPAQVVLRWNIQRQIITIPKSSNPGRIRENADIFDFELTSQEMEEINSLDKHFRYGPDPDNFDF